MDGGYYTQALGLPAFHSLLIVGWFFQRAHAKLFFVHFSSMCIDTKPVIGPVSDVPGYHLLSAFAGFGVMAAEGAGELCAAFVDGGDPKALPDYATAFLPERELAAPRETTSDSTGGGVGGSLWASAKAHVVIMIIPHQGPHCWQGDRCKLDI
jgi:hypothetical protein